MAIALVGPLPAELVIPRIETAPQVEDFTGSEAVETGMVRVDDFIQRQPSDGEPGSQPTSAYLGFDDANLYVAFVAEDRQPDRLRARLRRREQLEGEDIVSVWLDTDRDKQRAFVFRANPLGVQSDAMLTEGYGDDESFDTVWESEGRVTKSGYVVLFSLPFKSLRFQKSPEQEWNIILRREIPRLNEAATWPHVSARVEGSLQQAAPVRLAARLAPGRNFQLIPYGTFRAFRVLDQAAPEGPVFVSEKADPDAGLDAKYVLGGNLAVDVTLNPDFAQVESDRPQITVNRRFEVFFPERRPFFQENANLFGTPMDNLVFTRRIQNPELGARITGKTGPYAIGAFVIDDKAPGQTADPDSPEFGKRATFGVFRLQRDLFEQSSLGILYTERRFAGGWNRVAAIDSRLKFAPTWVAEMQGVTSSTEFLDGRRQGGPAWDFEVERSGRKLEYVFEYNDRSEGFNTQSGLVPRVDIRRVENSAGYRFRPEGTLIAWGPSLSTEVVWDHRGLRLDREVSPELAFELIGGTEISYSYASRRERLRPKDFSVLPDNRDFALIDHSIEFETEYYRQAGVELRYSRGTRINFVPPQGIEPHLADGDSARFELRLRPTTSLAIDNTYLFSRLRGRAGGAAIFNDHTFRSRWSWQFTRRLSLRFIPRYEATLANRALTQLKTSKRFNADFLVTYLVNPWTAFYVGYNSDYRDLELLSGSEQERNRLLQTQDLRNTGNQLFLKLSWLVRP